MEVHCSGISGDSQAIKVDEVDDVDDVDEVGKQCSEVTEDAEDRSKDTSNEFLRLPRSSPLLDGIQTKGCGRLAGVATSPSPRRLARTTQSFLDCWCRIRCAATRKSLWHREQVREEDPLPQPFLDFWWRCRSLFEINSLLQVEHVRENGPWFSACPGFPHAGRWRSRAEEPEKT